jgi:hypothetical protein
VVRICGLGTNERAGGSADRLGAIPLLATCFLLKVVMQTTRWSAVGLSVGDLITARGQLLNLKQLAERTDTKHRHGLGISGSLIETAGTISDKSVRSCALGVDQDLGGP